MTMKNGFSTINRLLGKQRDSSSNLSKSTTNLSVTKSTVNINDSSQLPQNRITPLPIATSNAPFEQTFRITVLLPRDQLYVARLGARVSLEKLLQLVCENKQLDADKYEFQHPADPSQIFSCDQTIGAVGLSEIRLCNKSSDNNNTFRLNGDNSSSRRNSFSSSKFSRNSKNISNTPSLYSSNYSLNSMGSSGVDSSNCRNISPEVATKPMAPVVPTRKKRLAPRPPSQNLSVLQSEKSSNLGAANVKIDAPTASSSSPDPPAIEQSALSTSDDLRKSNTSIDCNGNTKGRLQGSERCSEQCQETQMQVMLKSRSTLCIATSDDNNLNAHNSQPAPSPRRRVQTLPPKKPALTGPRQLAAQTSVENIQEMQPEMVTFQQCPAASPKSAAPPNPLEETSTNTKNVSRVFMFQNPHEESRSFLESTEQIMLESKELVEEETEQIILESKELVAEETCISKEPILEETVTEMKSPTVKTINLGAIFDKEHTEPMEPIELEQKNLHPNQEDQERSDPSWNSSSSTPILGEERKSFVESSSEDEEAIKVYDLKLGKTIVKTVSNQKAAPETVAMPSIETSHPANFLNEQNRTESPDLVDSSVVNGHNLETPQKVNLSVLDNESTATRIESLTEQDLSKQEGIINSSVVEDKLSIIQEIEKEKNEEPAKERIIQKPFEESLKPKEIPIVEGHKPVNPIESPPIQIDLQKLVEIPTQKAGSPINFDRSKTQASSTSPETLVKREPLFSTLERLGADEELEFEQHMRAAELEIERLNETAKPNLAARSSSFLSLSPFESAKNQKNQTTTDEYFSLGRRRSSSELSIGESPSLQSIGVIKSILLNSRKSGLNGSEESTNSRKPPPTECDIQSMEQPSPKSNNIFITNPIITTDKSKPRSAERIYRYSGPPNIQFSTWSERPKVQVAIKNEQDCVGDVSKNGPKLTSNDLALQRNGQSLHSAGSDCDLVRSTHKVTLRETRLSSNNSFEKEASKEQILRPKFAIGSRTSWAITTSPISAISNSSSLTQNNRPPLRPTSMMVQNSSTSHVTNNTQPIFGQGTLRKTGFKEKILASPDTEVDGSKPIIPAFTLKNKTQPQIKPKTPTRTETPAAAAFVAPVSVSPEAPPPPPIIRAVLTKQKTNRPQIERSISVDPRDQLLSAIRNFKRDELKNANNI